MVIALIVAGIVSAILQGNAARNPAPQSALVGSNEAQEQTSVPTQPTTSTASPTSTVTTSTVTTSTVTTSTVTNGSQSTAASSTTVSRETPPAPENQAPFDPTLWDNMYDGSGSIMIRSLTRNDTFDASIPQWSTAYNDEVPVTSGNAGVAAVRLGHSGDWESDTENWRFGISLTLDDSARKITEMHLTLPTNRNAGGFGSYPFGFDDHPLTWLDLPVGDHDAQVSRGGRYDTVLERTSTTRWELRLDPHENGMGTFEGNAFFPDMDQIVLVLEPSTPEPPWTSLRVTLRTTGDDGTISADVNLSNPSPTKPCSSNCGR